MTYEPKNLKLWTLPDSYMGAEWPDYYVFLGRHSDSDELTESNFFCGLKAIGGETETVICIEESHWAVGWVQWIAIHKSDEKSLRLADEVLDQLEDYPALNEDDFSEREQESAEDTWRQCFNVKERVDYIRKHRDEFEFHSFSNLMAQVRGKYFGGYASELIY